MLREIFHESTALAARGALGAAAIPPCFYLASVVASGGDVGEDGPLPLVLSVPLFAFLGGLWGWATGLWGGVFVALANNKSGKDHHLAACFIFGGIWGGVLPFLVVLISSFIFFLTNGYGGALSAVNAALPWTICGSALGSVFVTLWGVVRIMRNAEPEITRNAILTPLVKNLRYVLCGVTAFVFLATLLYCGYFGAFSTEKIGAMQEFHLKDGVRLTVERLPTPPFRNVSNPCVSRDGKSYAYFASEGNALLAWCGFPTNRYAICVNGKIGIEGTYPFGPVLMPLPFFPPMVSFDKNGNWVTVLHDGAYINGEKFNLEGYDQTCEAIVRDDGELMYHVRKGEEYYLVVDDTTYQVPGKLLGGMLFSQDHRLLYLECGDFYEFEKRDLFSDQVEPKGNIVQPVATSSDTSVLRELHYYDGSWNAEIPGDLEPWSRFYHEVLAHAPSIAGQEVVYYPCIRNYPRRINQREHSLIMRFPFQDQPPKSHSANELDDLLRFKEKKFSTSLEIPSQKIIMHLYGGKINRQRDRRWEITAPSTESVSYFAWRGVRFYRIRLSRDPG